MTTFIVFSANLHFHLALALLPVAAIGHWLGLKAHDRIMRNDLLFKRWIGGGLVVISSLGLWGLRRELFATVETLTLMLKQLWHLSLKD